jgi:nucleoid-associated protein YgaU
MIRLGGLVAGILFVGATAAEDNLVHVVTRGETLWSIAAKPDVYADPYLWPVIYRFNRDQIQDPSRIYPSQRLLIPIRVDEETRREARLRAGAPSASRR